MIDIEDGETYVLATRGAPRLYIREDRKNGTIPVVWRRKATAFQGNDSLRAILRKRLELYAIPLTWELMK